MKRSQLQLEEYFFTRVSVASNADLDGYEPDDLQQADIDVGVEVEFLRHERQPGRYQLTLRIDEVAVRGGTSPYVIELEVVGFFAVDEGLQPAEHERLVRTGGASMLYGAVREHLLSITARSAWGELQLPAVSFSAPSPAQP